MTGIGKLLVFVNLFVTVSLAIWATSLYVNRLNWLNSTTAEGQTVKGRLTEAQDEIASLTKLIAEVSAIYGTRETYLENQESYRVQRLEVYQANLELARNGSPTGGPVFRDFELVGRVGPLINIGAPGTVVNDSNGRPLRGLKDIQADLERSLADAAAYRKSIFQARSEHQAASAKIEDLDARTAAQRVILGNLKDEETYLGSLQVNWDEELRVINARRGQLERRLKSLD